MQARIFAIRASHPCHAVRRIAERKGIPHRITWLPPGMHPAAVRALGFSSATVPAMKLGGERIQNSREIARRFDELEPDPPLFPSDPDARRAVEEAEEWAEAELQPVPTRLVRWMAVRHNDVGASLALDAGMPLPELTARLSGPLARHMANRVGADDESVQATLEGLPAQLDHIDELIARGVIGGEEPNAADYQVGATLRVMLEFADVAPAIEPRADQVALAQRVLPDYPGSPIAAHLPAEWLKDLMPAAS